MERYMRHTRSLALGALIVMAITACGSGAETTTAPTTAAETTTTTPADTTNTTLSAQLLNDASETFRKWVGHLAAGETDQAWNLLTPTSQQGFGGKQLFDDSQSAMAEGWGSWTAAVDPTYSIEMSAGGRPMLVVSGTISPEGMTESREVRMFVEYVNGTLLLSPFES